MPKYLFQVSYTQEGLQGLLNEGGTRRREVVENLAAEMGGRLETFYYAFAYPESTEGRRRVSVLKWRKGAPLNLG